MASPAPPSPSHNTFREIKDRLSKSKRRHTTIGEPQQHKSILKETFSPSNKKVTKNNKRRVSFAPEVTLHQITRLSNYSQYESSGSETGNDESDGNQTATDDDANPEEDKYVQKQREELLFVPTTIDESKSYDTREVNQQQQINMSDLVNSNNFQNSDMVEDYESNVEDNEDLANLTEIKLDEIFSKTKEGKRKTIQRDEILGDLQEKETYTDFVKIDLLDFQKVNETIKKNNNNNWDVSGEEVTMELTTPISALGNSIGNKYWKTKIDNIYTEQNNEEEELREDTMELTKPISTEDKSISTSKPRSSDSIQVEQNNEEEDLREDTMEFTMPIKIHAPSSIPSYIETEEEEATMELTKPISTTSTIRNGINDGLNSNDPTSHNNNNGDDEDNEQFVDAEEHSMEFTKPISTPKSVFGFATDTLQKSDERKLDIPELSLPIDEEETMEFTKPIKINERRQQNETKLSSLDHENVDLNSGRKDANRKHLITSNNSVAEDRIVEENEDAITHEDIGFAEVLEKIDIAKLPVPTADTEVGDKTIRPGQEEEESEDDGNITSGNIDYGENDEVSTLNGNKSVFIENNKDQPQNLRRRYMEEGDNVLDEITSGSDELIPQADNMNDDEDSGIYQDEKTISNTIANSLIGNIPITSSPLKESFEDYVKSDNNTALVTDNSVNAENDHDEDIAHFPKDADDSDNKQRQLFLDGERKLPSPSGLNTSPLRKAMSRNADGLNQKISPIKQLIPKLPALNFNDQEILKKSNLMTNKGATSTSKKRYSLPTSSNNDTKKFRFNKRVSSIIASQNTSESISNPYLISSNDKNSLEDKDYDRIKHKQNFQEVEEEEQDQEIIDKDYKNITLAKFFKEINVKFFDDIVHSTILTTSLLPKLDSNTKGGTDADKLSTDYDNQLNYGENNEKLCKLELLTYGCLELKKYIKEGQEFYRQLDLEIAKVNPSVIRDFVSGSVQIKNSMIAQFHVSKKYSKLEAQNDWYNWKNQLIEDINTILTKRITDLNNREKELKDRLQDYQILFNELLERQTSIKNNYNRLVFQNKFIKKNENVEENSKNMSAIRDGLIKVTRELIQKQNELNDAMEKDRSLQEKISFKKLEIENFSKIITENENELNVSNPFDNKALLRIKNEIDYLKKRTKLKLGKVDNEYVTIRIINADNHEEYNTASGIDIILNYENLFNISTFKFEISDSYKFNDTIFQADPENSETLNSLMIEFLKFNMQKLLAIEKFVTRYDNNIKVFNFFRRLVFELQKLFEQLYNLSIRERVTFELKTSSKLGDEYSNLEEEMNIFVNIRLNRNSKRRMVKMELGFKFFEDLIAD